MGTRSKKVREHVLGKVLERHLETETVSVRDRQAISKTCRGLKTQTQQSKTKTMTAAVYMLFFFTWPFLLMSLPLKGGGEVQLSQHS